MTRFRYDAILRIGSDPAVTTIPFLDPPEGGWKLDEMQSMLNRGSAQAVGFARIGNSRIEDCVQLLARLANANATQSLDALRKQVDRREFRGIHPEEIFRIAARTGHNVSASWSSCYPDGSYDVAFVRKHPSDDKVIAVEWPAPGPADFVYSTNAPRQAGMRKELTDRLMSHCRMKLCDAFAPTSLHLVDSFPRRTDGTVDVEALLWATRRSAHPAS
jgi:hypothetical protein